MHKINVGIIGIGRIGKIHLDTLCNHIPQAEVIAAINPSPQGRDFAKQYHVPFISDQPETLFSNPDIQAVIICSSTDTHAEFIHNASHNNKAIFCEKPLDLSLQKTREIVNTLSVRGTKLMTAFNQRFDPNFAALCESLQSGKIGQPHTVHIISRDPMPPPIEYIQRSGGLFRDMTIHDFDLARFFMNCEVQEVFAKGFNLIDPAIGEAGDIDTGYVILNFENGATAIIENSRKCSYGYDQRVEIFGSRGMVQTANPLKTMNSLYNQDGQHHDRNLDFFMDRYLKSYQLEMVAFINALLEDKPMPVTAEDGLKAMAIAEAAYASMKENQPIRL